MSSFGKKLGHDIHTFGMKLGREARVFGKKMSDHPFRKISNTLHTVNGALSGASGILPILQPVAMAGKGLEAITGAMRNITFDGQSNHKHHKPTLER